MALLLVNDDFPKYFMVTCKKTFILQLLSEVFLYVKPNLELCCSDLLYDYYLINPLILSSTKRCLLKSPDF